MRQLLLIALFLSLPTMAAEQNRSKHSFTALYHLIQYANMISDTVAENFSLHSYKFGGSLPEPLTSGRAIKKAFAECAFEDNAYSTIENQYKAAHHVWKQIRDEVREKKLSVYRVSGFEGDLKDLERMHTYEESCGVSGAPCTVVLTTTLYRPNRGLFVTGDTCQ